MWKIKRNYIELIVWDRELDAMEDMLTVDYTGNLEQWKIDRRIALVLWARLCRKFDYSKYKLSKKTRKSIEHGMRQAKGGFLKQSPEDFSIYIGKNKKGR